MARSDTAAGLCRCFTASAPYRQGSFGFSLPELLVALLISGVLMAMLARSMSEIVFTGQALRESFQSTREAVVLRRALHRDFQAMTSADSLRISGEGIELSTTRNLLLDGPFPVRVRWEFLPDGVIRTEVNEDIGYENRVRLLDAPLSYDFAVYQAGGRDSGWKTREQWEAAARTGQMRAVRLTLAVGDSPPVDMVERLPDWLLR